MGFGGVESGVPQSGNGVSHTNHSQHRGSQWGTPAPVLPACQRTETG